MVRIVIGTILGTCVYFAWNFCAWMVLPVHAGSLLPLRNEGTVVAVLKDQGLTTGTYRYPIPANPGENASKEKKDRLWKAFEDQHKAGPIVTIFYSSAGSEVMALPCMLRGLAIDFIGALIAACLIAVGAKAGLGYLGRVEIAAGLGLFAAAVAHAALWNWMDFSLDWTLPMMADVVIGWTLVGIVQAAIIRPARALHSATGPTTSATPAA